MPKYVVAFLALLLSSQAARAFGPSNVTLEQLQPRYRVLLIFPGSKDPRPIVHSLERARDAMRQREVVWFILGTSLIANGPYTFNNSYRDELLRRYGAPQHHEGLVLIGRNGSVKLRERGSVNLKQVYRLLDGMDTTSLSAEADR